jgi:predicted nucleic acid-binding protein
MKTIIDISVWFLALRRKKKQNYAEIRELEKLISNFSVIMLGPIRQEILSGVQQQNQFRLLADYLHPFPDFNITTQDYENAAKYYNELRKKGIQGSNTDFLICSVAVNNDFNIFTTDKDFERYAKYLPIALYNF